MIRYYLAASALRVLSLNAGTKRIYRVLCNLRRRPREVDHARSAWILSALPSVNGRLRLLDLGTGWVHAYSLYPALLRDADIDCFDVWDNRSLDSFKATVEAVGEQIAKWPDASPRARGLAAERVAAVRAAMSFEEAYRVLGLKYHLDPRGVVGFPSDSFDAIYSIDVLEHVSAEVFPAAARSWFSSLRPGGRFIADFDLKDHLSYYDRTRGPKHFLCYSEKAWKRWFANDVQYFNRLTASQVLGHLSRAGFIIEEAIRQLEPMTQEGVHADHRWQSDEDIRTSRLSLLARKPDA